MWETIKSDVLVIGGGMAAARAAVEAAGKNVNVVLVDKGTFESSGSSPSSLNGIASALGKGSPGMLFQDIVEAGYHLNNQDLAHQAALEAGDNISQLEKLGLVFRKKGGDYQFSRASGQSAAYQMSYDREASGANPVAALGKEARRRGVKLCDRTLVTRLIVEGKRVVGAVGFSPDGQL